eukprot:TRINITY_DN419_c0_g2_i1.p1 TRINITY_DN419_c0_g2~~TRINITY_DN419_c0_g2_i1.p1  ORF type:complete len:857 (+),score=233.77 TRINITY_DN419_c0_g2_i1:76-2646(+)
MSQYPPRPGASVKMPGGVLGAGSRRVEAQPGVKLPGPAMAKTMPGAHARRSGYGRGAGTSLGPPPAPPSQEDSDLQLAMAASMRSHDAELQRAKEQSMLEMQRRRRSEEQEQKDLADAIAKSQQDVRAAAERDEKEDLAEATALSVALTASMEEDDEKREQLYDMWRKEFEETGLAAMRRKQRERFHCMLAAQQQDASRRAKELIQQERAKDEEFARHAAERDAEVEREDAKLRELQVQERNHAAAARAAEEKARLAEDAEAMRRAAEMKRLAAEAREKRRLELQAEIAKVDAEHRGLETRMRELEAMQEKAKADVAYCRERAEVLRADADAARKECSRVGDITRKVHNDIEDLKGSIRVYVRTRPLNDREVTGGLGTCLLFPDDPDKRTVTLKDNSQTGRGRGQTDLVFDRAFPGDATQEEVFEDCLTLCKSAIDGFNVCAFAYGQTGSGKTWTLTGSDEQPGVARRVMEQVFVLAEDVKAKGHELRVSATMAELYIDTFQDLLDKGKKKLQMQKSLGEGQPAVLLEQTEMPATTPEGLLRIFKRGLDNREVRSTGMNAESSRSHMIYAIRMVTWDPRADKAVRSGKLAIVDLAGSERLGKSGVSGQGQKEATAINKALTALGNVIEALSQKRKHIPFRDHELTQVMQEFLGGSSKTLMFVNVSPAQDNYSESKISLMFAQRSKKVTTHDKAVLDANKDKIQAKREEMEVLQKQLEQQQEKSAHCELEAQRKEAELHEVQHGIRDAEREHTRVRAEAGGAANRLEQLRMQVAAIDQGRDETPPPTHRIELPDLPRADTPPPAAAAAAADQAEPDPDEMRIDHDGQPYCWASFVEAYGEEEGRLRWDASPVAGAFT